MERFISNYSCGLFSVLWYSFIPSRNLVVFLQEKLCKTTIYVYTDAQSLLCCCYYSVPCTGFCHLFQRAELFNIQLLTQITFTFLVSDQTKFSVVYFFVLVLPTKLACSVVLTLAIPHSALVGSVGNDAAHVSELFLFFLQLILSVVWICMNILWTNIVSTKLALQLPITSLIM